MIKPKYNLGDKVWVIHNKRAQEGVIMSVSVEEWQNVEVRLESSGSSLQYGVSTESGRAYADEDSVFTTKEELIKSL